MKSRKLSSFFAATLLALPALSMAQTSAVPGFISYQGRVVDSSGNNVGTGTPVNRTVIFRIWDNPSSTNTANLIYSEAQTVTVSDGEFSVLVGQGVANITQTYGYSETAKKLADLATAFDGSTRYLGVTVAATGTIATTDNEVTPRQQIVSTAFAMRSKVAETVLTDAIGTGNISNSSITLAKMATASVNSASIVDGSIALADLAANSVNSSKIVDGSVALVDLADNSVNSSKIVDGSITGVDIATNTIPLAALVAAVREALVPPGTIVAYGGTTAPAGWLVCNGLSVSRSSYPALYTAIGNAFGTASSSTFNVPDLRGRFMRGWDSATGRDPDRVSRTAMNPGGNTGDNIGSIQIDQFRSHSHSLAFTTRGYAAISNNQQEVLSNTGNNGSVGRTTGATGGNETRPLNANVNYIIKY